MTERTRTESASPTAASPREVLARYHQAMIDLDADALAGLYAVDALHVFPFRVPGRPPRYEGREAVRAGYRPVWSRAAESMRLSRIDDVVVHESADPEVITG